MDHRLLDLGQPGRRGGVAPALQVVEAGRMPVRQQRGLVAGRVQRDDQRDGGDGVRLHPALVQHRQPVELIGRGAERGEEDEDGGTVHAAGFRRMA